MKRRRLLVFLLLATLSAGLAYLLRRAVYDQVIIPLAYLWWTLSLYYRYIPQVILWIILVFMVLFTAVRALLAGISEKPGRRPIIKDFIGPVEGMSIMLEKRKRGIYYKWLVANRLGKIAREMLDQREGQQISNRFTRLSGRDWHPPRDVEAYLETGLNGSFADYPQSFWQRTRPTPLDAQPGTMIEYLESEMELHRNGNR